MGSALYLSDLLFSVLPAKPVTNTWSTKDSNTEDINKLLQYLTMSSNDDDDDDSANKTVFGDVERLEVCSL